MKSIITTSALILSSASSFSQGPIASYPFSGNSNDVTGNGHNGTDNNITLTADRFGNLNSAYSFNGTDSYVNIGNSFSFTSHSFSIWFKPNSYPTLTAEYMVLVSSLNNGPDDFYGTEVRFNLDTTVDFSLGNSTSWIGPLAPYTFPNITLGSWNHVVFKYNHSLMRAYIYLNNSLLDSVNVIGGYSAIPTNDFYIGSRPWFGTSTTGPNSTYFYMDGVIDDINIYNYAINNTQIDSLYNYDPTLSIEEEYSQPLKLYPNPSTGMVTISQNFVGGTIQLFNLDGTVVYSQTIGGNNIDLTSLTNGVYLIRLDHNNTSLNSRLILIK